MSLSALLSAAFLPLVCGFYVPGFSPNEYKIVDDVPVRAVKLASPKTQLPYDYYHLHYCKPENGDFEYDSVNFGEIIHGDRIVTTAYKLQMKTDVSCRLACQPENLLSSEVDQFIYLISNKYSVHMTVDDLPISREKISTGDAVYELGYRIGDIDENAARLNNHLKFRVKYHRVNDKYRVVGVTVLPLSLDSDSVIRQPDGTCQIKSSGINPQILKLGEPAKVAFSYEVIWEESDIEWTSRWDIYLSTGDGQIHWFSIINSLIIIIFLTGVMAAILLRTLRRDISLYNREEDSEEIIEESGWKLVHGDVFRPPRRSALLAAFIGSGVQLLCMAFIVLFFAMLGMLSPASRGALLSAGIFTYVFCGALAGYFAGRIYKTMRGFFWKSTALLTGSLYPGLLLSGGLIINFFLWGKGSSAGLPFTTILSILSLWLLVSLPLVFCGFFFGFRKRPYEQPVRTNQIPRAIPERKLHQSLIVTTALCGILPFGSVFIELFFIFNAIWNKQFYYLFGFLFIVFLILIVSCAQVAIVATYFQLCSEDYHWWWRAFISSGGAALYVFLYSIYYFVTKLEITSFVSSIIYFSYCLMMSVSFWILTGTIGFFAALTFLRKIYAAIKID
nr:unnamed protein product [Spirometra erinaceieuropaei]